MLNFLSTQFSQKQRIIPHYYVEMEACFIEGGCEFFFRHLTQWKIACVLLSPQWIQAALSNARKSSQEVMGNTIDNDYV